MKHGIFLKSISMTPNRGRPNSSISLNDIARLFEQCLGLPTSQNSLSVTDLSLEQHTRLNNIIWREWSRQFWRKMTPVVVDFSRSDLHYSSKARYISHQRTAGRPTSISDAASTQPPSPGSNWLVQEVGGDLYAVCKRLEVGAERYELYRSACRRGTHKLHRQRIVIVGDKGAGKTSLKRALLGEPFQECPDDGADEASSLEVSQSSNLIESQEPGRESAVTPPHDSRDNDSLAKSGTKLQPFDPRMPIRQSHSHLDVYIDVNCEPSRMFGRNTQWISTPVNMVKNIWEANFQVTRDRESHTNEESQCVDSLGEAYPGEGYLSATKKDIQFTIWDFRGLHRGIAYSVLPPFLVLQTLYIVVLDATKGLDKELDSSRTDRYGQPRETFASKTPGQLLDFLLNSIHTHVVEKKGPQASPSVFVVVTKKDQLCKTQLESLKIRVSKYLEGKIYHNLVRRQPFFIDNSNLVDPDLLQLKKAICCEANQQESWNKEHPNSWMQLMQLLTKEKAKRKAYPVLHYSQFTSIAEAVHMNEAEAKMFLLIHHSLGDLVFFDEIPVQGLVILSPQWLLRRFEALMSIKSTDEVSVAGPNLKRNWRMQHDEHAQLSDEMIAALWPDQPEDRDVLLNIMVKFALILPMDAEVPHRKFMVPSLLRCVGEEEVLSQKNLVAPPLVYAFYMDPDRRNAFLPEGLFLRLVSHFCNRNTPWKPHDDVKADYAAFNVYLPDKPVVTVTMRKLPDAIQFSAYVLPPSVDPEDVGGNMLVNVRETFEHSLKALADCSGFYSSLEDKLWICFDCSCTQEKGNYIIIGKRTEDLQHSEIVCQKHHRRILTRPFRRWFSLQEASEIQVDEVLMAIHVQNDVDPTSKLQGANVYQISCRKRGVVYIVLNAAFESQSKLKDRQESYFDKTNLEVLFDKLNFHVIVKENQRAGDLRKWIDTLAKKDYSDVDSFFLCILSHGGSGCVKGVDGREVDIQRDIIGRFSGIQSPSLFRKPKVFLFQACRGRKMTEGRGETSHLSDWDKALSPSLNSESDCPGN